MLISSFILASIAVALSYWMSRRNPARSSQLTAGMIIILCVSPALFLLPKISIEMPWATKESAVAPFTIADSPAYFSYIWLTGSGLFLLRLLSHHLAVKKWLHKSETISDESYRNQLSMCCLELGIKTPPALQQSDSVSSPVVTGFFKPAILLPRHFHEWSEQTLDMVLRHELGHLQRYDLWKNLMAHITCALHWFNPLVWILKRRLLSECEFACDAHVISHGASATSYIHALCDVAQRANKKHSSAALAMAGSASLRNRVDSLLAPQPNQSRVLILSLLFCAASATFAVSVIRTTTQQPQDLPVKSISQEEVHLRLTANPFPLD